MMKISKGKLNPGFILIVFSLLTGSQVIAKSLIKNLRFETGVFSSFPKIRPAVENVAAAINSDNETENSAEICNRKVSGIVGVWMDDIKLTAETTGQIADEPGGAGVYYVSPAGNDNNTGTSPQNAWQTIEKINQMDFYPGDSILFEGGQSFQGNIRINQDDSGSYYYYLYIGSFGTGRAEIDAGSGSGLIATDCRYLSIKNLNFKGAGRKTGNSGDGLVFSFCSDHGFSRK